jgi:eukaryotic-like serine/threonine-protein kinase
MPINLSNSGRDALNLSMEPDSIRQLTPEQKDRLTEVLDGYFRQLEQGLPPPREHLLEKNPDLADPLRAYFDSLDELHGMAAAFPFVDQDGQRATDDRDAAPPAGDERRLGDFRLLREIGRGGMGVVYEAEQISLGRRVAVKVLPFAAVLDSRQIARFKHEAQSAAQLNHPNIVSVFAVGVERGVHFYAMQLIDGQPLDRALDELRAKYLPSARAGHFARTIGWASDGREQGAGSKESEGFLHAPCSLLPASGSRGTLLHSRAEGGSHFFQAVIRLAIDAASALHAAHESGIVHRDIKPSNLLLDGNGKIWVTDFGLARRDTNPTLTRNGDLVGTVRYMSPEQALGQAALVDHRTDIYSLAATLYELLTLEPAFPGDAGPALLRRIERDEPRPLRQLQPKIPADLETVILKGMSKRREDRYATAQEFAEDFQRVRDGKPTVARPPSLLDRATRWAQRHREVVAVAALIGVLALFGMTAATLLIARAERKTNESYLFAESRLRDAHDAVEKLGLRISDKLVHVPGAAQVRQDLLNQTVRYYRHFADQAKDKPEARADLALTYSKIGKLCAEIGSSADAEDSDKQAINLYQELAATNPGEIDYRRRIGVCKNNLALVLERTGRTAEARQAFAEAIRLQEEALGSAYIDQRIGEDVNQCRADLAAACSSLGRLQNQTGDSEGAAASIARAVGLQEQLLGTEPDNPEHLRGLAESLNNLGALYAEHQPGKAIEQYEKAAAMLKRALPLYSGVTGQPRDPACQCELVLTYNNLGVAQSRSGAVAQAAETYAKAVDLAAELVRQGPSQKSYKRYQALGYNGLGLAQGKLLLTASSETSFRHAVELQEALVKQDPRNVELQSGLGGIYNNLGQVLQELGRPADAVAAFEQAVAHQKLAVASAPEVAVYREWLNRHYGNYSRVLRLTGRPCDAAKVDIARRDLWPKNPQHLFSVAADLARDAKDISAAKTGMTIDITADQCGDYALETLKQAAAAGWRPDRNSGWTKLFIAIKNRAEFVALTRN